MIEHLSQGLTGAFNSRLIWKIEQRIIGTTLVIHSQEVLFVVVPCFAERGISQTLHNLHVLPQKQRISCLPVTSALPCNESLVMSGSGPNHLAVYVP